MARDTDEDDARESSEKATSKSMAIETEPEETDGTYNAGEAEAQLDVNQADSEKNKILTKAVTVEALKLSP